MPPTLYIFSGLPGTGKTTLSEKLAKEKTAVHLRIDTIEQGIRDLCSFNVQGEGYRLSYRIAADNLRLGNSVVADSCNPVELTRDEWENVAHVSGSGYVNIEVICSDRTEHRKRVEKRYPTVAGLILPTWDEVLNRHYDPWSKERIVIDTANKSIEKCHEELMGKMNYPDASVEVSKIKQERIQEKKLKPTQGSGNLTQLRLKIHINAN